MISQTLGIAGLGHLDRRIQPQLRRRRGLYDRFLEGKEPAESAGLSFTWRRAARGAVAAGSWAGRRLSLADYVMGTGTPRGATAAGGA
jgi:hypothetical protein